MSDFSVPDGGVPSYDIADIAFPLTEAERAYDAVTRLLAAIADQATGRNAAADKALANWTGAYGDYFRDARTHWLDGRALAAELQALQSRLLAALKAYQDLQRRVVTARRDEQAYRLAHPGQRIPQ